MAIERIDQTKNSYPVKPNVVRYGIKIPFQANENGGIKTITGRELDDQDIISNFLDISNKNAFMQNKRNFTTYIFKAVKSKILASIVRDARLIFDEYEKQHRFKLVNGSIDVQTVDSILVLSLSYENLENNTLNDLTFGLTG